MSAKNLQIRPPNWRQVPAALTNEKQDNFDQINADNSDPYLGLDVPYACQLSSQPSRDSVHLI